MMACDHNDIIDPLLWQEDCSVFTGSTSLTLAPMMKAWIFGAEKM